MMKVAAMRPYPVFVLLVSFTWLRYLMARVNKKVCPYVKPTKASLVGIMAAMLIHKHRKQALGKLQIDD